MLIEIKQVNILMAETERQQLIHFLCLLQNYMMLTDVSLPPSGMSAITTGLMSTIKTNDHILVPDSVYGSTRRFVKEEFPRLNIDYQFYNSRDIASLETLIKENTSAIYIETPGTYTFEIIDIEEVIRVCKKYKLKSIIDNTWATALYFNPLEFGVDIVIEAVTKVHIWSF